MIRSLIALAVIFKRPVFFLTLLLVYLCAVIALTPWYVGVSCLVIGLIPAIAVRLATVQPNRVRLWKFAWHVRRFCSIREGPITLCYAPELADEWDLRLVLTCCRREYEHLARTFSDVPLRSGVVYLFANAKEISDIFSRPTVGFALPTANIVVIAHDGFLRETIRHELVHLFSGRWNLHSPSILREGLAVHLQGSEHGQPLDIHACYHLGAKNRNVISLLDETFFYRKDHLSANYIIAGSFTGFLIRRFGWEKYRYVYRKCMATGFGATFQRVFLLTLSEAELQWRRELFVTNEMLRRLKKLDEIKH